MRSLQERVDIALGEVRHMLQQHGGDVVFIGLEDNKLLIQLTGACQGCPLSFFTLTAGIEDIVRQHAPEIEEIISVDDI